MSSRVVDVGPAAALSQAPAPTVTASAARPARSARAAIRRATRFARAFDSAGMLDNLTRLGDISKSIVGFVGYRTSIAGGRACARAGAVVDRLAAGIGCNAATNRYGPCPRPGPV